MLKDTLIIWASEFGRTPMAQGSGRDHHIKGYSMWMAGGGVKGGMTYGATDELGYNAVEDVVSVHDMHATMLHLLGIDHEQLTDEIPGSRLPPDRCPRKRAGSNSGLDSILSQKWQHFERWLELLRVRLYIELPERVRTIFSSGCSIEARWCRRVGRYRRLIGIRGRG